MKSDRPLKSLKATVMTVSKILYGIRMGLPPESFQILPPLFQEMTEVGHILGKLESGAVSCHSIYFLRTHS